MDVVGLAVIGAGYWGPNLVRNALNHPAIDLRWVSDLDEDRALRLSRGLRDVRSTADFEEALDDPGVAAVAIATPAATHARIAQACIAAGKHVLIEKPLAHSLVEGIAIVKRAEEAGLIFMSDHTFCYTGSVIELRRLIRDGSLGAIQYFDSVRINLGLVQSDTDVFWDLAPHDLSILDFVLPNEVFPVAVSAIGSDPIGVGHACVGYVSLQLSNGALAHIHVNWLSPTKVRTTIVGGSRQMVVWNDLDPSQKLSIYDTGVEMADLRPEERTRALVSYRTGDMIAPAIDATEALYRVFDEFASAIVTNRTPVTDGWAGVRVLEQLTAIQESREKGGVLVELHGKGT